MLVDEFTDVNDSHDVWLEIKHCGLGSRIRDVCSQKIYWFVILKIVKKAHISCSCSLFGVAVVAAAAVAKKSLYNKAASLRKSRKDK